MSSYNLSSYNQCGVSGPWAPGYCPPEGYQYPEYIQPVQQTIADADPIFAGLPPSLVLWLLAILMFFYVRYRIKEAQQTMDRIVEETIEETRREHNA